MGLMDWLKPLAGVASVLIPGVAPVLAAVNAFLPEGEKLPPEATGRQIMDAYEKMPPEDRVKIEEIAASVTIAQEENFTSRYTTMTKADGQSSRAAIARQMSLTLCGVILLFAYGFLSESLGSDSMTWQVFGLLVGTPASILLAYFGVLRKEHAQRNSIAPKGLLGMVAGALGKFK